MSRTRSGHFRKSWICSRRRYGKYRRYLIYRSAQAVIATNPQADLSPLQTSTAAILLRHHVWNAEKLQEQYFNDPSATLLDAGLSPSSSPSTSTQPLPSPTAPSPRRQGRTMRHPIPTPVRRNQSRSGDDPFQCPVCCDDFPRESVGEHTLAMGCGHRFCRGCWAEYVTGRIKDDGEAAKIQCMGEKCQRIVREEIVDELTTPDISKR